MEIDGLNGEPVFRAKDVTIGRVSGHDWGYTSLLPVTVDVSMERLTRRGVYETVDHKEVRRPLDFTITCGVWRPSRTDFIGVGSDLEPLEDLVRYDNGFTGKVVTELRQLGAWHLNSLNAACSHQIPIGKTAAEMLELTDPCPETGYRYGTKWLLRELPYGFLSRVRAVFAYAQDRSGIYDAEAEHE